MINTNFYAILPLSLIYDKQYYFLSIKAIILYSLFLNRMKFSLLNKKFQDSDGTFIYYSTSQICNHLRCSKESARKTLLELEQAGLIRKEYQKRGLPLKIYVNDIRAGDSSAPSFNSKTPQDKFSQKSYNNSNHNAKPHKSTSAPQEKQVSFDAERADKIAREELCHFSEKRKKRRTRNVGPTI